MTDREAEIDKAHRALWHAQRRGDRAAYAAALRTVWTMRLPWRWAQRFDTLRPTPRRRPGPYVLPGRHKWGPVTLWDDN